MKYTHSISVAGRDLMLISEDKPDYVKSLADELSRRIKTTMLSGAGVEELDAAIVCALDLMNENRKLTAMLKDDNG